MSFTVIKTGILSYGMSGMVFHAPFLGVHKGFELCAVVERTVKRAHQQYPTIKSYNSVNDLITDPEIELVVINTPNYTHFDFALKAIKAKKHVLIEKPFTTTSSQAKILFQEAQKNNCYILPFQNRRYDTDFLSVKSIVESGKLGNLVEVHFRFDRYRLGIGPKLHKEKVGPGSGLLYDLGPHLLDAAISLFGPPSSWDKSTGLFRPTTEVDDFAHIRLSYPTGMQVFITMSMLVAEPLPAFVLHGTKGSYVKHRTDVQEEQLKDGMSPLNSFYSIEKPNQDGILTVISSDGKKTREMIASNNSSYIKVFDDVYATIRNGKSYSVTEDQIICQLEIIES